nr:hypothetical protein B0A51_14668 [Rachicladosporium sp. CCFEE 5018]
MAQTAQSIGASTITLASSSKHALNPPHPIVDIKVPSTAAREAVDKAVANSAGEGVRVLKLEEYKQAAETLAEAFREDESSWYFLDTPDREHWTREQKWELHVKIFEYIAYAHLLKGLVLSSGPNYECVACWMPPGENMDDTLTLLRSGMWRLNYQLSPEGKTRFFSEFLPLLNDTKLQVLGPEVDADSWYLVYIGTRSTGRGKGYARKVIEHVTGQADREGRACYLESSHAVNRIIYGKMGFELQKNIYLQRAKKHVELDIMVRQPRVDEKVMGGA